jgi:rhodanese-related sulfurtransferase
MQEFIEFATVNWMMMAIWAAFLGLLIYSEVARGGSSLSPQQSTHLINSEAAVVLDIRKQEEFERGHIPNAINIPASQIKTRLSELDKHKDKPVIVACNLGHTAGPICGDLRKAGFKSVHRLKGGIAEWQNNRFPLVKK